MPRTRIAVMGCANIAKRYVIPAIKDLNDEFDLIAVSSRSNEKATEFANEFNCEAITGYDKLLARSDIDMVYIPLPTGLHEEWVLKSLESGKHVYVEKSLAMSYDSALKMVDAARKYDLVLMENFQFIHHNQHQFVKKLVEEGRIGSLRLLRASFGFPPLDKDNFRYDPTLGGGVLIDAAAYMVKVSQFWLGGNLKVKAATLNYVNGVDIHGGAYLTGENGEISEVAFGMDNFYQCNYELWGSEGKITADRAYTAPPGFKPKITLEYQDGIEEWDMDADNHFINLLRAFNERVHVGSNELVYEELLNQSRLLYELKTKAMDRE